MSNKILYLNELSKEAFYLNEYIDYALSDLSTQSYTASQKKTLKKELLYIKQNISADFVVDTIKEITFDLAMFRDNKDFTTKLEILDRTKLFIESSRLKRLAPISI